MKSTRPLLDPTPVLARQVIDLYTSDLADVRFPDLDLSLLLDAQAELHTAQLEVERIEALLAVARQAVEMRSHALLTKAERALSYARVFAQGDAELAPRVADIGRKKLASSTSELGLGHGHGDDAPKKRGRKPKAEAPSELFTEAPVADAE
ncbi:MAG: hypothetical protein ABW321_08595 [Polyangiales bacterium]